MLKFFAGTFAVAGLIAAAGPIIIHLLNRRRFRVVDWAAMDFLRKAMQRSRRAIELRDLLLLVFRCLAVAVFGAALARPFVAGVSSATLLIGAATVVAVIAAVGLAAGGILTHDRQRGGMAFTGAGLCVIAAIAGLFTMFGDDNSTSLNALSGRQPVHAVVLVDNSMSMGYESLEGTLLDLAKLKAAEFIDGLPSGSQFHIIPLCGSDDSDALSARRNKADARAALDRIQVADRVGRVGHALDLALEAAHRVPELEARRIVLLSDQQANLWTSGAGREQLAQLDDVQIMRIPTGDVENIWVSDFRLQDGVADTETPAVFFATVQHAGDQPLQNVQVTLTVEDVDAASQLIDLEPGQAREVEFRVRLDSVSDTGALGSGVDSAGFLATTVLAVPEGGVGDRLPQDNARHLVVPVVSGMPVVFIDQFGDTEDVDRGDVGETYRLRRLLAPRTSTDSESGRQLVRVRHVAMDRVTEQILSDARLVVIAGVESPGSAVPLLRQYVEQGGPLLIAAGADFDPTEWNAAAWLDGAGILPAPLLPEPIGQLPEVAIGTLEPFFLDERTMQHDFFLIEGESTETLQDLYREPLFFKAVQADIEPATIDAAVSAEMKRLESARQLVAESDERRREWSENEQQGTLSSEDEAARAADDEARREVRPEWLAWADADARAEQDGQTAETLAQQTRPRVLASYTSSQAPFLIERRLGRGRVLLVTSGLYSTWNTLTTTNAILMFDRILRRLLEDTLPVRNYETGDDVTLPAQRSDQIRWELALPGDDRPREVLHVDALSAERFGVRIHATALSGHYDAISIETATTTAGGTTGAAADATQSITPLAFNCPAEESELEPLDPADLQDQLNPESHRWLEADETLSTEGSRIRNRDLWKWLVVSVLLLLIAEMGLLAWPHRNRPDADPSTATA